MKPLLFTLFFFFLPICLFASENSAPLKEPLLEIFPKSPAQGNYAVESDFEVRDQFRSWETNSHWNPQVDEANVFHASLFHQSVKERNWEIRLGKGVQLYSFVGPWGEAMPPQMPNSQWNDETWQAVILDVEELNRPEMDKTGGTWIHQSGIYVSNKERDPSLTHAFYSPLLARCYDPATRSYSMLNWGQIADAPSIHRASALFFTQVRDMGDGVVEVTYVVFNYGTDNFNDYASPWGGVKTSVFPEGVLSQPDGSYRYHTPWGFGYKGSGVEIRETGGWAAMTQNAKDPNSFALGIVFGKDPHWAEQGRKKDAHEKIWQYKPIVYTPGDSRHGPRDYTVQAVGYGVYVNPGETFFNCFYMVMGTLDEVKARGNAYADKADYGPIELTEKDTPLIPLYEKKAENGQTILTRDVTTGTEPACFVYARPVKDSQPLFLMKETATGKLAVSSDPYLFCGKIPFENPYPAGNPKHDKYANRVRYQTYDGKTQWMGLLGFAMPEDKADAKSFSYISLSKAATDKSFFPMTWPADSKLLVRTK